jgi:hypothetical protein
LTPGEWIAFAALLLTVVSGGVSAAIWIIMAINRCSERITVLETTVKLWLPDTPIKFESGRMRRV